MPKKLNSVSLNSNCLKLIESYCAKEDISEAAFSRKFEKNNRWVADLRRGRSMNLPSYNAAAQMCVLLQTTPDEILLHQGETEEETAKCQKDIARVRDLLDQQRQGAKKETPDPTIEGKRSTVSSFIRESTDASVLLDIMNEVAQKLKELEKKNEK
jgi:hypothetical protein|nr:MAG TPA: helix-turn-helix domain protein [Caudoviricetes sp.]